MPVQASVYRFADLIVAGVIFLILALLTAPLVQRVLEAAHKMRCADNLRSVAEATHRFHADYNRLPPGWLGPNPDGPDASQSPQTGVIVHLLPYLKNQELYKRLRYQKEVTARTNPPTDAKTGELYDPPSNVPWWQQSSLDCVTNLDLARVRIPEFLCPSDSPYSSTEGTIVGVHINVGATPEKLMQPSILNYTDYPVARELGRTNFLGVAGCGTMPGFEGVFGNRSQLTLGQIAVQDGTSNTLMLGESCGGTPGPNGRGRALAFSWFAGALPTHFGLPWGKDIPWYAFSSRHRQVVHFALADGHVFGLRRGQTAVPGTTEWRVLQQLAGRKDGEYPGTWQD